MCRAYCYLQGRPFALKGRYYANIFIHFHPGDMQSAHDAAKNGDILSLRRTAEASYNELFEADSNGWQPFHEAARLGSAEILRFFLEQGAELDAQTNGGETALDLASKFHGKNSAPAELLRNHMEEAITDDAVGDVADEL